MEGRLTIRITTEEGETVTTILLEGQLTGSSVPDVRAACESANQPVRLDLSGMRSADGGAIRVIKSLLEAEAELHGASPYIEQLMVEVEKKA